MPPTDPVATPAWRVNTHDGLTLCVPPRLGALSSYILLEQEGWFEPEYTALPALLGADAIVLDIGANHGVYALRLAHALPQARVWAFEPTREPRERLAQSVALNGLTDRVRLEPIGLSDQARRAEFGVSQDSELNSLHLPGQDREVVELDTLDAFLQRTPEAADADFVKLDVEGEEAAVLGGGAALFADRSPLVMYEVKHQMQINLDLVESFSALGYSSYRLLPALGLLVPFDRDAPAGDDELLNLFACKPDRARALAERGQLASARPAPATLSGAEAQAALQMLGSCPFAQGLQPPPTDSPQAAAHRQALAHAAHAWLAAALTPLQRWAHLLEAQRQCELARPAAEPGRQLALGMLEVHLDLALGHERRALERAAARLGAWAAAAAVTPALFLPIRPEDLPRARQASAVEWGFLQLAEFVHRQRCYSDYFLPGDLREPLEQLLKLDDHAPEFERRYALNEMRHGRTPDRRRLRHLPAQGTANPDIWRAVLGG